MTDKPALNTHKAYPTYKKTWLEIQEDKLHWLLTNHQPKPKINIFDWIPSKWLVNENLLDELTEITACLREPHMQVLNAILWDFERLKRFCTGPSSLSGHHYEINGNLRHTIEVAQNMKQLCDQRNYADCSLGILAAFLHDIGKADEYILNAKGSWEMSERGRLIGHKATACEWFVVAANQHKIVLPQDHYLALLHMLSAVPNAPDWMGLRQPITPECLLLSMADRLSGQDDLMVQTISPNGGFGRYHKHLKSAPFRVRG